MNWKHYTIKTIAIITTIASIVFSFFGWIMVDTSKNVTRADTFSLMNLSDIFTQKDEIKNTSFLEDWSNEIYEGYLPELQAAASEDEADAIIKKMDSDITTLNLLILIPCGVVKGMLLLSVLFALYGIVRTFILRKRNMFIISSQIMSLVMQAVIYVLLFVFNFVSISVMDTIEINSIIELLPTYYLLLTTLMSAASLVLSIIYQRKYLEPNLQYEEI